MRHTLWAAAQYTTDPRAILRVVNAALLRDGSDRFVTMVVAILTPGARSTSVDAVWAGHPPGLVLRHEGAEPVIGEGLPLGMFEDLDLDPVRFALLPGETLLLYTDVLAERMGGVVTEQEIAAEAGRVCDVTLQRTLERLAEELTGRQQRDDIAMLAVRR